MAGTRGWSLEARFEEGLCLLPPYGSYWPPLALTGSLWLLLVPSDSYWPPLAPIGSCRLTNCFLLLGNTP